MRLVEAGNEDQAETLTLDLVGKDARLNNKVLNEVSDPPLISIESVRKIPAMAYDVQNRANTLIWQDEDTENKTRLL